MNKLLIPRESDDCVALRIERVELQSMKRVVKLRLTKDDKESDAKSRRGQSNNCDAYNMVLQNGLLTSFPKQMSGGSGGTNATIKTFIFAHNKWGHGRWSFQALEIDFHST